MITDTQTTDAMRILQADSCPSLSGRTIIDFQVGCDVNEHVFIRVALTSGNGFFSKEWIRYDSIAPLLVSPLTAASLRPIFQGKSVNTSGFLLAVMKHLGFVQAIPDALRGYQVIENPTFEENTKKLIADGIDMNDAPANTNGKKLAAKGKVARKKLEKVD